MPQHTSVATYKLGSESKTAQGQSGNHKYKSTTNENAKKFLSYLYTLKREAVVIGGKTPNQREKTENKYATTCSEPKAIYNALCDGANPSEIHIWTTCDGAFRLPCAEFCNQYITKDGYLDWSVVSDNSVTLDEYRSSHAKKQAAEKKEKRQKEIDDKMAVLKGNPYAALALLNNDSAS